MQNIVIDNEPCRACKGTGGHYEETQRGTRMFEDCFYCQGSGSQTVRFDKVEKSK